MLVSQVIIFTLIVFTNSLPTLNVTEDAGNTTVSDNDTIPQDLYVIKTVVYEIGILTDPGNDTDENETSHEQVDFSFFDPKHNGSLLDLSNIPIPVQTNVSGVAVTGLLPSKFFNNGSGSVLPQKQIKVTQNISTTDPEKGSRIISSLPHILGLNQSHDAS